MTLLLRGSKGPIQNPLKVNGTISDLAGSSEGRKRKGLAVSFPSPCHFRVPGGCDEAPSQRFLILIFILYTVAYIIIYNTYGCLILRGHVNSI